MLSTFFSSQFGVLSIAGIGAVLAFFIFYKFGMRKSAKLKTAAATGSPTGKTKDNDYEYNARIYDGDTRETYFALVPKDKMPDNPGRQWRHSEYTKNTVYAFDKLGDKYTVKNPSTTLVETPHKLYRASNQEPVIEGIYGRDIAKTQNIRYGLIIIMGIAALLLLAMLAMPKGH